MSISKSEFSKASDLEHATYWKRKADRELLLPLAESMGVLRTVLPFFLEGKIQPGKELISVSGFFSPGAEFYNKLSFYQQTLSFLRMQGCAVPSPDLVDRIRFFNRIFRHCGIPDKTQSFLNLHSQTESLISFVQNEFKTGFSCKDFDGELNGLIFGLVTNLKTQICPEIQLREEVLRKAQRTGVPAPKYTDRDVGDFLPEYRAMKLPPKEDKVDILIRQNAILISQNEKRLPEDREIAYRLYRDLMSDPETAEDCPKVAPTTRYIRYEKTPCPKYAARIQAVRDQAKKNKHGEEAFWSSVDSTMRTELAGRKRQPKEKPKPENAAPGPVPIPDRSWA